MKKYFSPEVAELPVANMPAKGKDIRGPVPNTIYTEEKGGQYGDSMGTTNGWVH